MKRVERGASSWLVALLVLGRSATSLPACGALLLLACGALSLLGCGEENDEPEVTFRKDIHPIFVAKCGAVGCHNEPGFIQPGHGSTDVDIAYDSVTSTGSIGMTIYQRIVARIGATDARNMMPPNPPCGGMLGLPGCVTQAEYDLIKAWVDEGHPK